MSGNADRPFAIGLIVARPSLQRRLKYLFADRGWPAVEAKEGWVSPRCGLLVVDIDRLAEVRDKLPVLALTHGGEVHNTSPGVDVRAYVDPDDLDGAFVEAVQEITAGHGWISPTLVLGLLRERRPVDAACPPAEPVTQARKWDTELTARESEVVSLVTQGMNNSEIAGALYIAESTVKFHMSNILQKTGFRDRGQLTARVPDRQFVA